MAAGADPDQRRRQYTIIAGNIAGIFRKGLTDCDNSASSHAAGRAWIVDESKPCSRRLGSACRLAPRNSGSRLGRLSLCRVATPTPMPSAPRRTSPAECGSNGRKGVPALPSAAEEIIFAYEEARMDSTVDVTIPVEPAAAAALADARNREAI